MTAPRFAVFLRLTARAGASLAHYPLLPFIYIVAPGNPFLIPKNARRPDIG
jgi:hypothetical protein